jgi:acetoin utilization transport system permease protein
MFNRILWAKHYKHSKYLIWSFLFISLLYPLNIYFEIENLMRAQSSLHLFYESEYLFNASYWITIVQIICLVVLSTILQGHERSNQSLDITLSLPFKRKDIFLSKWGIGVVTILVANVLTLLLTIPVIVNSLLNIYLPLHIIFIYFFASTITLIGIYSLGLLVGQIVGNQYAQFFTSALLLLAPFFFWLITFMGIMVHLDYFVDQTKHDIGLEGYLLTLMFTTTMPIFLVNFDLGMMTAIPPRIEQFSFLIKSLITPLLITTIYLSLIGVFSKKVKSENNGKLFVYKQLYKVAKITVVLCAYFIGGWIFAGWIYPKNAPVLFYHVGGILFAFISYIIASFMEKKQKSSY